MHDENGNEDPAKLAEAAIPRPAAKKRRLTGETIDLSVPKKVKRPSSSHRAPRIGDELQQSEPSALATTEVALASFDAALPLIELAKEAMSARANMEEAASTATVLQTNLSPEDEVNLIATSPLSEIKFEPETEDTVLASNPALSQHLSSLVSPPESTHTDGEQTPPVMAKPKDVSPPATAASSR